MSLFIQLTINGLIAGSIYALVASGFSLIYGTNRFLHFAHGISVVAAGYILFWLFSLLKVNIIISILLTIILTSLFGFVMYRGFYFQLQKKKASNVILLISSLALLILFQNIIQVIFGAEVKVIGLIKAARGLDLLGAIITPLQIIIVLTSVLLLVGLYFFMKKTKLGRDMRAVSDNKELALIAGINERKVSDYSFLIGSAIAGVAGVLIALEQNLDPNMGVTLMVKGFTGAVIGGITSVPASVLGSYFLGLAENYGIWFLPSGYKDAIAFVLLFLFLLFRAQGLFGIKRGVK